MRKEILLAGFGGQGIISIGILIACAAGKYGGKHVAQAQSYGPEARGGACKAEVVIDDGEIDYIKTLDPNVFIVMSQLALDQYIGRIDPEKGIVIADSSLVTDIPSNYRNVYRIPATDIAEKMLGARLAANIVMFGTFSRITGYSSAEECKRAIEDNMAPKFHDLNFKAFEEGVRAAEEQLRL